MEALKPSSEAIREHYDSLAFIYRAFWGDHIHHGLFWRGDEVPEEAQLNLLDYCCDLVQVQASESVLDVGCGHGGTAIYLAQKYGCHVDGLTLSQKQARIASDNASRAKVETLVKFAVGNAEIFPLPERSYDLIWTMESSEHFQDKAEYLCRAASALRSDGRLLLAAWTGSMQNSRVRAVAEAFLCPELQTREQYISQMEHAGLHVSAARDLTSTVIRTWEICNQRARAASAVVQLLPKSVRNFVEGIPVILDAYQSGDLAYTVVAAYNPAQIRNVTPRNQPA